jgi:multidrug transporter EmrE-like cation transporter
MQGLLLAVFTALCSGSGICLIKAGIAGGGFRLGFFLLGIATYGIGIVCGLVLVAIYPLSIAYPIVVGLSLALLAGISAVSLGEPLTPYKLAGTALIVLGVVLLVRPGQTTDET